MTNDISILEATTTTAPETGNINNILQYTKLHQYGIFSYLHMIYIYFLWSFV